MSLIFYNYNKTQHPNMFYNFSFETQTHLDEECHVIMSNKPQQLQNTTNTTNTSPASVKSQDSFAIQLDHHHDCSFEIDTQHSHASNIWDASVHLLNQALQAPSSKISGFNDQDIYRYTTCSYGQKDKTMDQAIKSNRFLRYREKADFIETLQKETQLCGLLVEMFTLFSLQIFSELTFIIHTIWNQKYLRFRERRAQQQTFSLSHFSCFFGSEGQEGFREGIDTEYKDAKQIVGFAQEDIQNLAKEIFNSRKIRYLNFQDIKGAKMNNGVLREEFEKFISLVSKEVFLCAEGIYEEQVSIPIFSEQEEEELALFDLDNSNRFVRAYSQISQDDETQFKVQAGSKHRKLF